VDQIKPENLRYFSSPEEALAAGYQPCKGCDPPTSSSGGSGGGGGGDGGGGDVGSEKGGSSISCTLSTRNVLKGETLTVSGTISPSRPQVSVSILFRTPSGSVIEKTVDTDSSGAFSGSYTVNALGTWAVHTSWSGDGQYNDAESPTLTFNVWQKGQLYAIEVNQTTTCTSIVDGDSFYTTYGEVRLADLDCPDQGDSGYIEARTALSSLILNENIILDIDDIRETDPYDRYVCVVYVEYNATHLRNVNYYMVSNQYAVMDDYTNNEFSPYTWQPYVSKPSKQISCAVSPSRVIQNESITVTGMVTPPQDAQPVRLDYSLPDGTRIERNVVTDSDGSYSDS
jgi:endonuclease YncB( thermonuclease family)